MTCDVLSSEKAIRFPKISAIFAACCLISCSAQPAKGQELKASELYIEVEQPNWYHLRTADPAFIKFPWALRAIRKAPDSRETVSGGPDAEHCKVGCSEFDHLTIKFGGERVLSVERTASGDNASPRGFSKTMDYTYDIKARKRIRFGDIFTSWPSARTHLQRAFCESLDFKRKLPRYTIFAECPSIDDMVFFLEAASGDVKQASHILIRSGACIIGPCAAGPDSQANEHISIGPKLGELIKPKYRPDFYIYEYVE